MFAWIVGRLLYVRLRVILVKLRNLVGVFDSDDKPERRELGYYLDIKSFPRGTYQFVIRQYAGSFLNQERVKQLLQDLAHPLSINVRALN